MTHLPPDYRQPPYGHAGYPGYSAPPGPIAPAPRRTTWPTTIGIIGLVCGIAGLIAYGCCGAGIAAMIPFLETLPDMQDDAVLQAMAPFRIGLIAAGLLQTACATLLVVGAIQVLSRRPSARGTLMAWAVLKILVSIGADLFKIPVETAKLEAEPMAGPAMGDEMIPIFVVVIVAVTFLWQAALPLFTLIWFSRSAIRTEMRSWAGGRA